MDGDYRLTDCVHQLIRSGLKVENYQLYDPDEVQGINSDADFEQAEFILQKRLYRPRRQEEQNLIAFGTGGWRALIGEGFTLHNVRRLSQALSNEITRQSLEKRGVIIGYDRRFLSKQAAEASAEVFAGNDIPTIVLTEDAPTPLITYATAIKDSAYGLAFTASHNPPEWNGLKVFRGDGSLLLDDETRQIEREANALTQNDVIKLELDLALEAGIVEKRDFTNEYVDAVEALIDLEKIRERRPEGHRRSDVRRGPAHAGHGADRGTLPGDVHPRAPQSAVWRTLAGAECGGPAAAEFGDAGRELRSRAGHGWRCRPRGDPRRARRIRFDQRHPAAAVLVPARNSRRTRRRGAQSLHVAPAGSAGQEAGRAVLRNAGGLQAHRLGHAASTTRCWAASRRAG